MPKKAKKGKKKVVNSSRRTRRSRGPTIRSAPAFGPSTPFASSSFANAVGINTFSQKNLNYRYHVGFGTAPPHEQAGGIPGLRLHVKTSKHYLMRSSSNVKYIFNDGTNYFEFLSMNPLADAAASHTYSPILGAGSPAAKIVSMFTRYAVRSCKMRYSPSRGFQETGTYGMVFRPDVETTMDTFAEIKNSDNFHDFSVNKESTKLFISSDLRKPASTLYFVDETKISDKDRAYQGYLQGCSQDLQASADLSMGDLVFELVIDCYALQGDPNPASGMLQTLLAYSSNQANVARKFLKFLDDIKSDVTKNFSTQQLVAYANKIVTPETVTKLTDFVVVEESKEDVKESKEEKKKTLNSRVLRS